MQNNEQYDGFFIQNVLPGQLVICDPPHVRGGLYIEPLQSGEVCDLSYYDPQVLSRSMALDKALKNGYAIELSAREFDEQIAIAEERQVTLAKEMQEKIVEAQAAGNVFEAEQINLATAGNPHGDSASEALMAQKNSVNEARAWSSGYKKAKAAGLVKDPIEFTELVDSGRISIGLGNRGQKVSLAEMQNLGASDQINMTSTKASIAMPGEYNVLDEDGKKEGRGGVYTQKRQLTNFNATGSMVGAAAMDVIDSPTPAYSGHPGMRKQAEDFVEDVDLDQEDDEYERQLTSQNNQVAERLTSRPQRNSPYLGGQKRR